MPEVVTLYRPVGKNELALIEESGFTAFPPRLPEQPIFYPVTNEEYATQIARDWNAKMSEDGVGCVTKFNVNKSFLDKYERQVVGGSEHEEYWIPAEDLTAFNASIVGSIEVIAEFYGEARKNMRETKEVAQAVIKELDACLEGFDEETPMHFKQEPFFACVYVNRTKRLKGDDRATTPTEPALVLVSRYRSIADINPVDPNVWLVFDRTWAGGIHTEDYGNIRKCSPHNTGWYWDVEVLERCVFEVDSVRWDAVRADFHSHLHDEFIASLRSLLSGDGSPRLEQWELMSNAYGLRSRHGLDGTQDSISRLPLASQLIISGPAGSGKTTTMIRRLAVKSDLDHAREKGESIEALDSWIAFTPSDTLRSYLKEAMTRDGLLAPIEKVRLWKDERLNIAREYLKFIGPNGLRISPTDFFDATPSARLWGYYEDFRSFLVSKEPNEDHLARNLADITNYYLTVREGYLNGGKHIIFKNVVDIDSLNTSLCYAEIDLIILVMLQTANKYFRRNQNKLEQRTDNDLLENIKTLHKRQVVVDEAPDFSAVQLGCIFNLADPRYQSVMFAGDPMQRLTLQGITYWEECNGITDFAIKPFNIDYRQTPKLQRIANVLAGREVHEVDPTDRSPNPLKRMSLIDDGLASWLSDRIHEIYSKNANTIPAVAVIVPNDACVESLHAVLSPKLLHGGFLVEKCLEGFTSGEPSRIRIFSIDFIKGLEFDSVFFVSVDQLAEGLMRNYLYVGVTRSRAFLAVTYEDRFPRMLADVEQYFVDGTWENI